MIDGKEHFVKQSQRSRTQIYGANGLLPLIVPLQKYSHRDRTEDVKISYADDWQTLHWRSFEAAYRNTAYFEFYEDDLKPFYTDLKIEGLMDFNSQLESEILALLKIDVTSGLTEEYKELEPDWRILLSPKNKELGKRSYFPSYQQMFDETYGFLANLSIVDLLFNLGPHASNYLKAVRLELEH